MLLVNTEATQIPEVIPPKAAVVDANVAASKDVNQLSVAKKVVDSNAVKESSQQETYPDIEKTPSSTQEDAPKKSYASIVGPFTHFFF